MELLVNIAKELLLAWRHGGKRVQLLVVAAILLGAVAFLANIASKILRYEGQFFDAISTVLGAAAALIGFGIYAYRRTIEEEQNEERVERAEQRVKDNPDQPQAAWDLARIKLESYLNRNLNQVRSIFWLTALVMLVGFTFIGYGIVEAFNNLSDIKPALLSTVSGLLVNFIGATFLVLYKSTMEQSKEYVAILERINAVGMSVQVLEKIDVKNKALKDATTAELSKQLLAMYEGKSGGRGGRKRSARRSGARAANMQSQGEPRG